MVATVKVLKNIDQVEALRSVWIKKEEAPFTCKKLRMEVKKYARTSVFKSVQTISPQACGLETPDLHIGPAYVRTSNAHCGVTARYSMDYLVVECVGADDIIYNTEKGEPRPFYCVGDAQHEEWYVGMEDKEVFCVSDGKLVDGIKAGVYAADGTVSKSILVYGDPRVGLSTVTPSQIKKGQITYRCSNKPEDVRVRFDKMTDGMSSIMLAKAHEVSAKEIAQAAARASQPMAPSSLHEVTAESFAMYGGKFKDTVAGEVWDGDIYAASEFVARTLSAVDPSRYIVAPLACDGMGIQCRPFTCKTMAQVWGSKAVFQILTRMGKKVVYRDRDNFSKSDQKNFNLLFDKKLKKTSEFWDKIIVVKAKECPDDNIELFTDLNGCKAPFALDRKPVLTMLDMAHGSHDIMGSKTSTQLLQSLIMADLNATCKLMMRLGTEYIDSKVAGLLGAEDHAPSFMDFVKKDPEFEVNETTGDEEVSDNEEDETEASSIANLGNIVTLMANSFVTRYYRPMYKTQVNAMLKGISNAINRLNLPTKGGYAKIVSDPAISFGKNILKVKDGGITEVICPLATAFKVWRLIGVKYPKMHYREFLKAVVVTPEEYALRVIATDLTDVEKNALILHVNHMSKGIIVVPATDAMMHMLAGMDFDGDAVQLFFDDELVSIMWLMQPLAVYIDHEDGAVSSQTYVLDRNVANTSLYLYDMNANMPVGKVTIQCGVFMALIPILKRALALKEAGDDEGAANCKYVATYVFDKVFSKKEIKRSLMDYVSPFKEECGENELCKNLAVMHVSDQETFGNTAGKVTEQCRSMVLTASNMLSACDDLVANHRMFQELTIDGAKTMEKVEIGFATHDVVALASREGISINIDWKEVATAVSDKRIIGNGEYANGPIHYHCYNFRKGALTGAPLAKVNADGSQRKRKCEIMRDAFYDLQMQLLGLAVDAAKKLATVNQAFPSNEWIRISAAAAKNKAIVDALFSLKMVYANLSSIKREQIAEFKNAAKELCEDHERYIKDECRKAYTAFSNQCRVLMKDLSADERAELMLYTAFNGENSTLKNDDSVSSFAHIGLPEEFFLYVLHNYTDIKETCDRLIACDFEDGEEVEFVGGFADQDGKRAVAKEALSGRFIIRKNDDGKFDACHDIESIVTVPAADESTLIFTTKNMPKAQLETAVASMAPYAYEKNGKKYRHTPMVALVRGKGDPVVTDQGVQICSYFTDKNGPLTKVYGGKAGLATFSMTGKVGNNKSATVVVLEKCDTSQAKVIVPLQAPAVKKSNAAIFTNPFEKKAAAVSAAAEL